MNDGDRHGAGDPSSSRRIALTLLVIAGAASVIGCWWLWHNTESNTKSRPVSSPASDQASEGLGPVMVLGAEFVGNETCAECHIRECDSFSKTSHSRTLGPVKAAVEPADGEFYHAASNRHYRAYRDGDTFRHREFIRNELGEEVVLADHPLSLVVGSGHHARTYLIESDGFLMESPLTWYASKNAWEISPGFDSNNSGFSRPIYVECLFCHSGRVETVEQNRGRIRIHEHTMNCERCHGPGSAHVKFQRGEHEGLDDNKIDEDIVTIVNPGKLGRARKEAICAQCHLHGDAEVDISGKMLVDFKAGDALSNYRIHYSLQSDDESMRVVGHVEQLRRSKCYQRDESMTCTTCHDPHSKPATEERVAYFRTKCLECHATDACEMPRNSRLAQSPQDDCVTCHMPSTKSDIPHFVATHHHVRVYDSNENTTMSLALGDLVPIDAPATLSASEKERYLGLSYLDLSLKEESPESAIVYRRRAETILEKLTIDGASDPEIAAALAQIYHRQAPRRSMQFAKQVLQSKGLTPQIRIKALFALSESYIATRQTREAIPVLEQLTKLRRQAGDWYFLAACRYQENDLEGALEAGKVAAELRPDQPNFQALLAELYSKTGQTELAKHHDQLRRLTQLQL